MKHCVGDVEFDICWNICSYCIFYVYIVVCTYIYIYIYINEMRMNIFDDEIL